MLNRLLSRTETDRAACGANETSVGRRKAGFDFQNGEVTEGIAAVAVCFTGRSGTPQAAVAVSLPASSFESVRPAPLTERLQPDADELARRLGAL